jgi:signal recognition particle GTPase
MSIEGQSKMKVKELTVEQFKDLVQEAVEEKLEEIIGDPDLGLELREEIKERLRSSLAARQRGEKGIPMDEVAKRAGLDW